MRSFFLDFVQDNKKQRVIRVGKSINEVIEALKREFGDDIEVTMYGIDQASDVALRYGSKKKVGGDTGTDADFVPPKSQTFGGDTGIDAGFREAVEYAPGSRERMHPSIEGQLTAREHPLGGLSAYPEGSGKANFEEVMASKRFQDIVAKVKHYTGNTRPLTNDYMGNVVMMAMGMLEEINAIEMQHKEQLEELATRLVMQEFGVEPDSLKFEIEFQPENMEPEDVTKDNEPEEEPEEAELQGSLNLEVEKRRFINAMIQGSSAKGHYMFHLVEDDLNAIDPNLVNMYGVMMSVAELLYWLAPDEQMSMAAGGSMMGKEEIDLSGEKPVIKIKAFTFPVLMHEMIKGVMELVSAHGLPKDVKSRKYVTSKADTLQGEYWDIRLGPGFWQKFMDTLEIEDQGFRVFIYHKLVRMPAPEFLDFIRRMLKGDASVKFEFKKWAAERRDKEGVKDAEKAMKDYDVDMKDVDNIDDVDLGGILPPGVDLPPVEESNHSAFILKGDRVKSVHDGQEGEVIDTIGFKAFKVHWDNDTYSIMNDNEITRVGQYPVLPEKRRDTFFSQENCDRCHNPLAARTMSWFTDETICMDCADKETEIKKKLPKGGADYEGCGHVPQV